MILNALEKSKQEAEKNEREAEIQLGKIKLSQIEKQLELAKVRKESEKNHQTLESGEPSSITDKLESLECKLPSENNVQSASRLSATFDYYCHLRKVNEFHSLCDLIISDKICETLDRDTMNHIATKQGETYFKPQQLGRECDVYLSTRGKVSNDLMSRNPGSGVKTDGRDRGQTVGTWRQERNSSNVFVAETETNCVLWQNEGSVEANSQSQFVATGFEKGRLKNVFLSTVYELVKNKYSQWVEVRCLLDVGSQSSLCTRVCAEKLQLKMEKINTVTSCVNDASMVVKNCVKTSLANEAKNFEKFVPLADDKFNIPDRIDMLLVAEIFYKLLKPLKFCCDNSHLVLQNTVFGYVENSKDIAIRRLNSLRKRLSRDSRYLSLCAEFLKEYEELGHLEGIHNFTDSINYINPNQYGFTRHLSTYHPLLRLTEKITSGFQRGRSTGAVFLDIQKVFDRVWSIDLFKFNSYLVNRSFQVKVDNTLSSTVFIKNGVTQGSLLGPILFNIYINDIPSHTLTMTNIYAYDTSISATYKNHHTITKALNAHLILLEEFFNTWKIKINVDKTVAVLFTRRRKPCTPPTLYSTPLHWSQSTKYLGLVLEKNLTWKQHILYARDKFRNAMRSLYPLICRNSHLNIYNKVLLYTAVLRPILAYGCPVWGYAANSNIKLLDNAQNALIRNITRAYRYNRNRNIYKVLKIPTFKAHIKNLGQKFFDNLSNINNVNIQNLENYDPNIYKKRPRRILLDSYNPP
ncbi:RNA-directed DNA polymerase from mobile element jockey [Trichonephila clavipes]|nr:RNA-directed DNA polymerase from mobile element jockey [Trichonephila clavipes]